MKKSFCLIICIILIVSSFAGCNQTATPTGTLATEKPAETVPVPTYTPEKLEDEVLYDGELYKLERIDGQCYIILKDKLNETEKDTNDFLFLTPLQYLTFKSIEAWIDAVTISGLTAEQLDILTVFAKEDSYGRIPVCELERLCVPVLPSNLDICQVTWFGEYYVCKISDNTNEGMSINIEIHTESSYSKPLEEKESFFSDEKIEITDTVEDDKNGIVEYYYSTAVIRQGKLLEYTFTNNDISYTVVENYVIDTRNAQEFHSSSVPHGVTLYCEGNGMFFTISIEGLNSRPDKSYLSQISAKLSNQ